MEPVRRMLIHKPIIGLNGRTYICIFKHHFYFENDSVLNRVSSQSLYDDSLWSIDREKNLLVSPTFYGSNLYDISIEVNSQKRQMFMFRPGNALINVGNFLLGGYCSKCGEKVNYNERKYCESCGNKSLFFSGELDYPKDFLFPPESELHEALEKYEWIDSHYMKLIINSFPISINSNRETINKVILELAKLDRRNFEALH